MERQDRIFYENKYIKCIIAKLSVATEYISYSFSKDNQWQQYVRMEEKKATQLKAVLHQLQEDALLLNYQVSIRALFNV